MKWLILVILFPAMASAQTVHIDDDEIEYKGEIKAAGMPAAQVLVMASRALREIFDVDTAVAASGHSIESAARLRLKTPYALIRTVDYTVEMEAKEGELKYKLKEFLLNEKRRGFKNRTTPSKDLIESLEEGGQVVIETEKILNEIDMRLQEKLARLKQYLKKE